MCHLVGNAIGEMVQEWEALVNPKTAQYFLQKPTPLYQYIGYFSSVGQHANTLSLHKFLHTTFSVTQQRSCWRKVATPQNKLWLIEKRKEKSCAARTYFLYILCLNNNEEIKHEENLGGYSQVNKNRLKWEILDGIWICGSIKCKYTRRRKLDFHSQNYLQNLLFA